MAWTQPVTLVAAGLQLSEIQTQVLANCGNIPATHPIWVKYDTGRTFINEAGNHVLLLAGAMDRKNWNMFPEMRDWRWDQVTIAAQAAYDLPTNLLVPDSLTYTQVTTAYAPGTDTEYQTTEQDIDKFKLLTRGTSKSNWPQLWTRAATQLLINPTPVSTPTDYRTRMILYGVKQNAALSAATDRWEMNPLWHGAGVDYATSLALKALGRDAAVVKQWEDSAETKVTRTVSLLGSGRRKDRSRTRISTSPEDC